LAAVGAASAFGVYKASAYMAIHPTGKLANSKFGVSFFIFDIIFLEANKH
jgi:hypothetical protein